MATALAASPAYNVRFRAGPLPSTLLEVLLLLAIALGLGAVLPRLPRLLLVGAAVLLAGATLGVVVAPDRLRGLGIWRAYFLEPMLAAAVIAGLAGTRRRALVLAGGLGVAGTIVALANLEVALRALGTHSFDLVTPPVAIYTSANAVPLYLVPLDALAAAIALHGERPVERAAAAAFLALTGLAVLLSYSRAGWLALLAVVLFALAFGRRGRLALAPLAVGFAAAVLVLPGARRRIAVEFDPADPGNTINTRLALWRSTSNLLHHRPFSGGGLAGFSTSVRPYRDPAYQEGTRCCIYPHNLLLDFWSETTLLGLAGFLLLAAALVRLSLQGLRREPWVRALAIGTLGLLLAFAIHGLVDNPYFKNDQALAFWAVAGLLAAAVGSRPAVFSGPE